MAGAVAAERQPVGTRCATSVCSWARPWSKVASRPTSSPWVTDSVHRPVPTESTNDAMMSRRAWPPSRGREREMKSITPLESKHALDLDGLRRPEVTFWSVIDGETLVACGGIKELDSSHAEVKSMRTEPSRKKCGVASILLQHMISEAKRTGYSRLSLETGSIDFFAPARGLYLKHGFEYCEPFADYKKTLTACT